AGDDERDSARNRGDAGNRRNRNGLCLFGGRMDRTDIKDSVAILVMDASRDQGKDPERNQQITDELHWANLRSSLNARATPLERSSGLTRANGTDRETHQHDDDGADDVVP